MMINKFCWNLNVLIISFAFVVVVSAVEEDVQPVEGRRSFAGLSETEKIEYSMKTSSLQSKLDRQLFPAKLKLNQRLINFFSRDLPTLEFLDEITQSNDADEFFKFRSPILSRFVESEKNRALMKIQLEVATYENRFENLKNGKLYKNIKNLELLYEFDDGEIEEKFTNELDKIEKEFQSYSEELLSSMERKFPDANQINKEFVKFVRDTITDPKMMADQEEFFSVNNKIMKNYMKLKTTKLVLETLRELNREKMQENYDYMKENGSLDKIDANMIFKPKLLKSFIEKNLEPCESRVSKKLQALKPYEGNEWSKTPEKCIIFEICHKLSLQSWNDSDVDKKISKYQSPLPILLDEIGDIFLDKVETNVNDDKKFKGDKDCVVVFVKRNEEMRNLYDPELISDDEKFEEVVEQIKAKYAGEYFL